MRFFKTLIIFVIILISKYIECQWGYISGYTVKFTVNSKCLCDSENIFLKLGVKGHPKVTYNTTEGSCGSVYELVGTGVPFEHLDFLMVTTTHNCQKKFKKTKTHANSDCYRKYYGKKYYTYNCDERSHLIKDKHLSRKKQF